MSESKATRKVSIEVKQYKGLKHFEIVKDSQYLKKGQKVELTFKMYKIFKSKKLVK